MHISFGLLLPPCPPNPAITARTISSAGSSSSNSPSAGGAAAASRCACGEQARPHGQAAQACEAVQHSAHTHNTARPSKAWCPGCRGLKGGEAVRPCLPHHGSKVRSTRAPRWQARRRKPGQQAARQAAGASSAATPLHPPTRAGHAQLSPAFELQHSACTSAALPCPSQAQWRRPPLPPPCQGECSHSQGAPQAHAPRPPTRQQQAFNGARGERGERRACKHRPQAAAAAISGRPLPPTKQPLLMQWPIGPSSQPDHPSHTHFQLPVLDRQQRSAGRRS